jgi:predicted MPP superfamily phosphohydrolase
MTTAPHSILRHPAPVAQPGAGRFEFGAFRPLLIRAESVGPLRLPRPASLLYISDLHLGLPWTIRVGDHIESLVRRHCPDITFLGGDLVDRTNGLATLSRLVHCISQTCPVWAVPGNHDVRFGIDLVRGAVQSAGGGWLAGRTVQLPARTGYISFHGNIAHDPVPPDSVLITHNPNIFPQAARLGYRLVLAGHLHGGQCVVGSFRGKLYPGAWLSPWTRLRFERHGTTMLVSRGAADTLPLRWNCPREAILCHLF